jgi:hypothetical protein
VNIVAVDMRSQTEALNRLLDNVGASKASYALRYFIIALCCWLFVYLMKRSSDAPLLLVDSLLGANQRVRSHSRASYARSLSLFCGSYEKNREAGILDVSDVDWDVFCSEAQVAKDLGDHFRDLGVRAGIVQPRSPRAKQKHIELQADTVRALSLSVLAKGEVVPCDRLQERMFSVWRLSTGGSSGETELLQRSGCGLLDRDDDLEPNSKAFRALLVRLGLAVEPSDGLTLCAINAEELI